MSPRNSKNRRSLRHSTRHLYVLPWNLFQNHKFLTFRSQRDIIPKHIAPTGSTPQNDIDIFDLCTTPNQFVSGDLTFGQ